MIATLLASIYITLLCHAFGQIALALFARVTHSDKVPAQHFIVTCLTGLATISVVANFLSLFFPLGNLLIHLTLLSVALTWYYRNKATLSLAISNLRISLKSMSPQAFFLIAVSTVLILIMHAWHINHPDTLIYHAQNIQWAEKYRVIPGLVNLQTHYGFQSSWFILCALFSFSFIGLPVLTFINATILIWFVIFTVNKIDTSLRTKGDNPMLSGFLWLALLIVSFVTYTQIRLTATSASPDFIVALYLWLIFYLFFEYSDKKNPAFCLFLAFIGFFAITIKLSSAPIFLLIIFIYWTSRKHNHQISIITAFATGLIILSPQIARNFISTGYFVYPLTFPNIITTDWQAPKELVDLTRQYITAYARVHSEYEVEAIKSNFNLPISGWIHRWWKILSVTDKIILASIPSLLLIFIIMKGFAGRSIKAPSLPILVLLLLGDIIWFLSAPDPRFGYGFLLPTAGILIYSILSRLRCSFRVTRKILSASLSLFAITVLIYSAYRLTHYFTRQNIYMPSGVINSSYEQIDCNGVLIHIPVDNSRCGSIPLPCTQNPCGNFTLRGQNIVDGFRASEKKNIVHREYLNY